MHPKLKFALIAALAALLLAAPALAAEPSRLYFTNPSILKDDSGLEIHLISVGASDTPRGSYEFAYPPSQYRFYILNYTVSNPTNQSLPFDLNVAIKFNDSNGTTYGPVDQMPYETIPAGKGGPNSAEYAIPRTAHDLSLVWTHLDRTFNTWTYTDVYLEPQAAATPTPTAGPTANPTATATPTPTPTGLWEPLLPLTAIVAGAGIILLLGRRGR